MKVLFTDLDNTLLTTDKRISDTDLASIRKMMEDGHRFVIASGRPINSVLELAEQYDLIRPGLFASCFNGSLIYDVYNRSLVSQTTFSTSDARFLFREAAAAGLHVHTYSETHIVADHPTAELDYYVERIHMPVIIDPRFEAHLNHDPWKLIVMSMEARATLQDFQTAHAKWQEGRLNHTFSCDFMLEYSSIHASKGSSVEALCKHFAIPLSDAIAVGDEENDISMIEAAGVGVAMNNGIDSVKAVANYITERDNDHSAVSEVINRFILNAEPSA